MIVLQYMSKWDISVMYIYILYIVVYTVIMSCTNHNTLGMDSPCHD